MIDKEKIKEQKKQDFACCGKQDPCCGTGIQAQESSSDEKEKVSEENVQASQALHKELELCRTNLKEWEDKFTLLNADFQNYRKRIDKERVHWMRSAHADVLKELLTIIDGFDRAFEKPVQKKQEASLESWISGFLLIQKSLHKILEKFGVQPMQNYTSFDPKFHEALMQVDSAEHESGAIVQVLQKGYLINGEVLRPAKVSVAK